MGAKVKNYLNLKSVLMSSDVDNCFIYSIVLLLEKFLNLVIIFI